MQLSDHQMGSGQYAEIAVMGRPPLAPTALNKLAQGRARNERRPVLLGPKRASPVRARQTVATFVTPASGLTAFASIYPGRCFLARPPAALFPTATSLGWLVKGLWPMPKNSHQTVLRLKRSTLEKPPWHDAAALHFQLHCYG